MNRSALVLAGAAAPGIGLSLGAVSATAAPQDHCPSGNFCIWEDTNYLTDGSGSKRYFYSGNDATLHNDKFTGTNYTVGDNDQSWFNNGVPTFRDHVQVFRDTNNQGGMTICLVRGTGWPTRSTELRGSSFTWDNNCTPG